ncbi:hypothetical protein DFS33DRAFT_1380755 [Desarmillaria ectypa]|nr:hypothetical protein DFS33DRAFT_1380755 [Desarmillaria ectypa]
MISLPLAEAYFIALGCEVFLNVHRSLASVDVSATVQKKEDHNYHRDDRAEHRNVGSSDLAYDNPTVWEDNASPNIYSQILLEGVNIIIGDGIVIWRAWVLWGRKWWVIFTSGTLLTVTLAAAIGIIRAFTMAPPGITVFDNPTLSTWAITFISSTLTTNLWATSLVAYRAWSHNKFIQSVTGETLMTRFRRQNGILAILIESGVFYSCTWLVAIITFLCGTNGIYPVIDILSQLTAVYPTLIITLVCLRSTLDVAIETFQQTTYEWTVGAGTVRSPDDILTTTSYPLNNLRIGVQMGTDESGSDQLDSTRSGVEGSSTIRDKPRYDGLSTDDRFDVV